MGNQVMVWHVPMYVKKLAIDAVRPSLRRYAARIPFARRAFLRLRALRGRA